MCVGWRELLVQSVLGRNVGVEVCAGAKSGKAASLVCKREIDGGSVHIRTCNTYSRTGSVVKVTLDRLEDRCFDKGRGIRRIFRGIRASLFRTKTRLTAPTKGRIG